MASACWAEEVEVVCRERQRWMSMSGDGVGRVDGERLRLYRQQGEGLRNVDSRGGREDPSGATGVGRDMVRQ